MIIYIYGPDNFRSRQYLKEQVEKFKKARDPQGYNVVFLDTRRDNTGKILGEIVSVPFLAERRLIVVENVLLGDVELVNELIERIKNNKIPESNVVIFFDSEMSMGKSKRPKNIIEIEDLLKKEKYSQEFLSLTPDKLSAWVLQKLSARGATISRPALTYLLQNIGTDMWQLHSLLEQLAAYKYTSVLGLHTPSAPGGHPSQEGDLQITPKKEGEVGIYHEIQLADAQLFLDEKVDDNVFNMVEAIVAGRKKEAYKLLTEQRRLGEEDGKIIGLIIWQFRTLISMRSLFDSEDNVTSDAMAKKLKIHPFVAKKNLPLVRRHNLTDLQKVYKELLDIDLKTKTGQGEQGMLLDMFVGRV